MKFEKTIPRNVTVLCHECETSNKIYQTLINEEVDASGVRKVFERCITVPGHTFRKVVIIFCLLSVFCKDVMTHPFRFCERRGLPSNHCQAPSVPSVSHSSGEAGTPMNLSKKGRPSAPRQKRTRRDANQTPYRKICMSLKQCHSARGGVTLMTTYVSAFDQDGE